MATGTSPSETTIRVRHPLDAVRSHIRRYVLLETTAAVLLFIALWFWVGLVIDYGLFFGLAHDWILELNFLSGDNEASRGLRIGIFAIVMCWLGYVLFTKLLARFWREFSDPAVALVLERRFPKELGDRLITAVELSDPKKAESYGFSGIMLAQTINEAAERVERLPVEQVLDWARLRRLWMRVILVSVGSFLAAIVLMGGARAARGQAIAPVDDLCRFKDTASIWIERNVLFQDSYWLRNAQLEVVRFQDAGHPGEMRVGRDESRPDLIVRSVSWVVPDSTAIGGWRAMRVAEAAPFLSSDAFSRIDIPGDWPGWTIDLDDLDVSIPTGAAPVSWQGKPAGEVAKELAADKTLTETLTKANALDAVRNLGDWRTWTLDKFLIQVDRPEIKKQLAETHPAALTAIAEMMEELRTLAASPWMNRRLRELETPSDVGIVFRGATTRSTAPGEVQADQKFSFGLGDLKESVTFFVRGGDFVTPPLRITLSPPPTVRTISIDKEEPAYLYYWLAGDQTPLRGKKQIFQDVKVSVTGETSVIDVPLGTRLTLRASVDRRLKDGIKIGSAEQAREAGTIVPGQSVTLDEDGLGFSVRFDRVDKTMDFQFEFHDEDNVKGRRRVRIRPIDDQPPDIRNFELDVVLRKPRFKDGLSKSIAGGAGEGFLVTPDAVLPFAGSVHDDNALVDLRWSFDTEPVVIEGPAGKDPGRVILQGNPTLRRTSLVVSSLQFSPMSRMQNLIAPAYLEFLGRVIELDLKRKAPVTERSAPLALFQESLQAIEETPIDQLGAKLAEKPGRKPFVKEHQIKRRSGDQEVFAVKQHLPDLKMKNETTQAQIFHMLKLSVAATDNNVETGPSTSKTRTPVFLLVVPETVLLAQISLQEEVLRERLEKVVQKLRNAKTTMSAQTPILRSANPETDYSLVVLRVDEVRKALLDTASETRDIHSQYNQILQELIVNRVKKDKISDVNAKIVQPLELIINPTLGSFALAEDVIQRLAVGLDDDIATKNLAANMTKHVESASQTEDQIAGLIEQIEAILSAIDQGLDFNEILQRAIALEQGQRQVVEPLRVYHDRTLNDLLEDLIAPRK